MRDVDKRFGEVYGVSDLSLDVEQGEVFGLLGPNGAGKSTTLDLLLGFTRPTCGDVRVLGMDPVDQPVAVRTRVGVLPDAVSVEPSWTGRQHVTFVSEALGIDEVAEKFLRRVGIADAVDRPAGEYSKGMRQRLLLGLALVGDPDVLLLDEPSTGIDPEGMKRIREIVREERDKGTTVVFSSHRLPQVEAVADRVGMIADGTLVDVSSTAELQTQATDTLRISVDTTPEVLAPVANCEGVFSVQVDGNTVEVACTGSAKRAAIDAVERTGSEIRDIEIETRPLEDYFIDLSDEDERATHH